MDNMIRNPYRDLTLRRSFDTMVDAAFNPASSLYLPNGGERRGGGHSCAFWDGFHNVKGTVIPGTIGAACYRAGRGFANYLACLTVSTADFSKLEARVLAHMADQRPEESR